jgi:hypothetical protein
MTITEKTLVLPLLVRRSYAHEHYSSALHYGADAPPSHYICADCGETSADAGRYRKAEAYELQDDEGECYECSTCGCQMALPPPPNDQTLPTEGAAKDS